MRTKDEILDRALALILVASKGCDAPEAVVSKLANGLRAVDHLSPIERKFYEGRQPGRAESTRMAWRFEAARVLFWALGLTTLHAAGERPVNVAELVRMLLDGDLQELRRWGLRRPA